MSKEERNKLNRNFNKCESLQTNLERLKVRAHPHIKILNCWWNGARSAYQQNGQPFLENEKGSSVSWKAFS